MTYVFFRTKGTVPSLTEETCCFAQVQVKYLFGYTPMANANHHGNPSTLIREIRKKNPTQNRRTSAIFPQIDTAFGGFLLVIREILWCDGWILGCCFLPGDFCSFAIFSLNTDP